MSNMKKLVYFIFGLLIIGSTSCVDDFEDANPPPLLDGPATTEAIAGSDVVVSGGSVDITVTVVDAPGGLDSASVIATDALGVDRGGTAVLTSGQGITEGQAVVTYTSLAGLSGGLTLSVRVWDGQVDQDGDDASKGSDPLDVEVTLLCGLNAGTYNGDGNILVDDFGSGPYTFIENITLGDCETEDEYLVSDISGGLYGSDYADAYGTDPAAATLVIAADQSVSWTGVSDQFGGEIIEDPAGLGSNFNPTTSTFTIYWTATQYGERGITTYVKP